MGAEIKIQNGPAVSIVIFLSSIIIGIMGLFAFPFSQGMDRFYVIIGIAGCFLAAPISGYMLFFKSYVLFRHDGVVIKLGGKSQFIEWNMIDNIIIQRLREHVMGMTRTNILLGIVVKDKNMLQFDSRTRFGRVYKTANNMKKFKGPIADFYINLSLMDKAVDLAPYIEVIRTMTPILDITAMKNLINEFKTKFNIDVIEVEPLTN